MDYKKGLTQTVQQALAEDIGEGDITAELISAGQQASAHIICREQAILCGQDWFNECFGLLDPDVNIEWTASDGDTIKADQTICILQGNARALLSAERTALNFLQTLSATASLTHHYMQAIAGLPCKILDTRKTIPGLRLAQKYAVHCGGGHNHRIGLFDAILIKENHIAAAGSISTAVTQARAHAHKVLLEVEVENLDELQEAITAGVDRVLLDNMQPDLLREAVRINNGAAELEASGGITLDNIRVIAETGVDYISTGSLTKDIKAIDLSMRISMAE